MKKIKELIVKYKNKISDLKHDAKVFKPSKEYAYIRIEQLQIVIKDLEELIK